MLVLMGLLKALHTATDGLKDGAHVSGEKEVCLPPDASENNVSREALPKDLCKQARLFFIKDSKKQICSIIDPLGR